MDAKISHARTTSQFSTPSSLGAAAVRHIAGARNALLADTFALYFKTKNFHRHASGPNFRDYHLLLDEQAGRIFAMTDTIAERVRSSAERPCGRSDMRRACSASRTT